MSAHTPGPWMVGQNGDYEDALMSPTVGRMVAYAAWTGGSGCELRIENDADARLIAAAPDLLAAVEFLLDQTDYLINTMWGGELPDTTADELRGYENARAAIAKAVQS